MSEFELEGEGVNVNVRARAYVFKCVRVSQRDRELGGRETMRRGGRKRESKYERVPALSQMEVKSLQMAAQCMTLKGGSA